MLYESKIISALKQLQQQSNLINILADRDGVEPPAPYCLVSIIDVNNVGQPYRTSSNKNNQLVETLYQLKEIQCSLTFHMKSTDTLQDYVEKFHMGLGSTFFTSAFANNGLGVWDYTDIVYQSFPIDGMNYKRAIIDIRFRFERKEDFYSDKITRVETKGHLGDSYDDFVADVDFNTTPP